MSGPEEPPQPASVPAWPASTSRTAVPEEMAFLARRHSVGPKFLGPPAPTGAQWSAAVALALRAPDHGGLRPFRFVIVGDEQRATLAELFAQDAARRRRPADEVEKARARAHHGPGLAALVGRVRDGVEGVPPSEQWVCIGAALMNFLNALHLMGFGAKALSGASVRAPAIARAFCASDETLVAWIVAGTPLRAPHPKGAAEAAPPISRWRPE
jgi:nitroreductase